MGRLGGSRRGTTSTVFRKESVDGQERPASCVPKVQRRRFLHAGKPAGARSERCGVASTFCQDKEFVLTQRSRGVHYVRELVDESVLGGAQRPP